MDFAFATSNRILFGDGRVGEAGKISSEYGSKAFVITGSTPERAAPLIESLQSHGMLHTEFSVSQEPTIEVVTNGLERARAFAPDVVIGIGGGSVLDTGKAIAVLLTNGDDPLDFLEVIGRGKPLQNPSKPYIAIPTTSGTGSEVTRNAVLASEEHHVKVSLRSAFMLPDVALIDPSLTYNVPPHITASTGLDALTQVIEPYISRRRNPMTDGFCLEGIPRAVHALQGAYLDGSDAGARRDLAITSLMGGLALANAGLGAVHGFAGPFGGMFHAPHGAICAALLPHVLEVNRKALVARSPEDEALSRLERIGKLVTSDPSASAQGGISWIRNLVEALHIPALRTYGFARGDFPDVIEKAKVSSSMRGNPIELTEIELEEILDLAY
ncbi:MAG: iron-containing alcohol dehydrogenase [Anaerolineales bacterium]